MCCSCLFWRTRRTYHLLMFFYWVTRLLHPFLWKGKRLKLNFVSRDPLPTEGFWILHYPMVFIAEFRGRAGKTGGEILNTPQSMVFVAEFGDRAGKTGGGGEKVRSNISKIPNLEKNKVCVESANLSAQHNGREKRWTSTSLWIFKTLVMEWRLARETTAGSLTKAWESDCFQTSP